MSDAGGPSSGAKRPRFDDSQTMDSAYADSQSLSGMPESDYEKVSRMMQTVEMSSPGGGGGGHFKLNQAWTGTVYFEGSTNVSLNSYDLYTAACLQHPVLKPLPGSTDVATTKYTMEIHGYTMEGADNNTIIMDLPNYCPDGAKGKTTTNGDINTAPTHVNSNCSSNLPPIQPRKAEFAYPVVGQSNAKLGFSWPESMKIQGTILDSDTTSRAIVNFQSQAIDPATVSIDKFYAKFLISVRYCDKFTLSGIIPTFQIENIKEFGKKVLAVPLTERTAFAEKFWGDKEREAREERVMIQKVKKMRMLGHDIPKNQF